MTMVDKVVAALEDAKKFAFVDLKTLQQNLDGLRSSEMAECSSPDCMKYETVQQLRAHVLHSQNATFQETELLNNVPIQLEIQSNILESELMADVLKLEDLVINMRSQRFDLEARILGLEELKKELEEAKGALHDELQRRSGDFRKSKVAGEWEKKIKLADIRCAARLQEMLGFVSKYFPPPTSEEIKAYNEKFGASICATSVDNLLSMRDIVELLMDATLQRPHDAYNRIDPSTCWPPYIELLLRVGIALRHPTDTSLLRMTPYHHQ